MYGSSILHADLDAFYASVEQQREPSLRGRPVIVGGGVVLAASYEAKRRGVDSGMSGRRARALCPDAVVVSPDLHRYGEVSREVMGLFREFTPLVEPLSPDEAFLDVAGARRLLGSPAQIAGRLRERVRAATGLAVSVGVARTKFLAKVASGAAKPDGLVVVPPDGELAFLHPLPVQRLWGVGPVTTAKLAARGIVTVGDLARLPPEAISGLVGSSMGRHLHALGWNHDPRTVDPGRTDRSVGSQQAVGRVHDVERVDRILLRLADRVTSRLRRADLAGRTITVKIRFADDFAVITRSRTLRRATQGTGVVHGVAEQLVHRVLRRPAEADQARAAVVAADRQPGADLRIRSVLERRGVSLLGLTVSQIGTPRAVQQELPFRSLGYGPGRHGGTDTSRADLDDTVDRIRARFGREAITAATLLREGDAMAPSWAELQDRNRPPPDP